MTNFDDHSCELTNNRRNIYGIFEWVKEIERDELSSSFIPLPDLKFDQRI